MTKFTDIIRNVYWKANKRVILYLSVSVICLGIAIYSYFKYAVPRAKNKNSVNVSNSNRREQFVEIYFFNAKWCPHCVKCMGAWSQFVNEFDGTIVNGYTINCIGGAEGVDCSDQHDPKTMEISQRMNINKFPTLKMIKDKDTIDFDAKITKENLTKFVNSVLS